MSDRRQVLDFQRRQSTLRGLCVGGDAGARRNKMETEMLNMRRVLGALLALVLLAPWGVLRAGPGVTDSEIVIGQSLGLTGRWPPWRPNW
jgi:hypothetical protein